MIPPRTPDNPIRKAEVPPAVPLRPRLKLEAGKRSPSALMKKYQANLVLAARQAEGRSCRCKRALRREVIKLEEAYASVLSERSGVHAALKAFLPLQRAKEAEE